ncbi:hypothetical protein TVAG_487350 [Trichomonas vaginalis G3]|uniref:Uncharacterized protein n=1 Tax=Trichomonas vaginalis (strain ATCC PRA-98 / G3) TaxID=412133 RepID=A2EFL6_TRIV3|nr:hypothetical protein TVAG_487350 [Trichomonas vaginalis G3]|eukprot:XP_001320734.1 hypothetical protein [Trichomonas vaginalis G3]
MQLPAHASQLRGIYELNSPRRIYDEWMCLSEGFSAPPVTPPKKYPHPDELDTMFGELSGKTLAAINSQSISPQDLRNEVFKSAQLINSILDNYSNLVNTSAITSHLNGPNSGRMQQALNSLEIGNANTVVILNQFTSHVEILANPRIPVRNHWDVLRKVHTMIFTFLKDYVNRLRNLFKVVSYEHVMGQIGDKSATSSLPYQQNRPAMASFGSISPLPPSIAASLPYISPSTIPSSQPAQVQEDPQIAALHESCSNLMMFSQGLMRNGYTWKATIVNQEIQAMCQSIAEDVYNKMNIVEDMFDDYMNLSPQERQTACKLPEGQINLTMEQMRGNINVLRMLTTKFTLGKVYEVCNTFIKQIALIVRELRVSFFARRNKAPRQLPPYQNEQQQQYYHPPPNYNQQQPMYQPPPQEQSYYPSPQQPSQQYYGQQPPYQPPSQQQGSFKLKDSKKWREQNQGSIGYPEIPDYPDVPDL